MQRTTVMLPLKLKLQARRQAKKRGVSLSVLVRESLTTTLDLGAVERGKSSRASDSLFADEAVFIGDAPTDLSINHDRYLYGELDRL